MFSIFFIVSVTFVLTCQVRSESLLHGYRTYDDVLLHNVTYATTPIWLSLRYEDVTFPQYFEDNNYTITVIDVRDNLDPEDGGFAEVDYGGYGYPYANIHLRSQRGKGYNFTVEIYGVPFV